MKKSVIGIVAVIVIAGVTVLVVTLSHNNKTKANGNHSTTSSSNTTYAAVDACDVMTGNVASHILGSTSVKGTMPGGGESTDDIAFSDCIYTAGPTVDPPHTASVAVRSAKDSTGASSNKAMFTSAGMPASTQPITGYGNAAYWDPSMGQLDILKGNNWYIVSNYTGTSPANGTATLAMAEQLAQAVKLQ